MNTAALIALAVLGVLAIAGLAFWWLTKEPKHGDEDSTKF